MPGSAYYTGESFFDRMARHPLLIRRLLLLAIGVMACGYVFARNNTKAVGAATAPSSQPTHRRSEAYDWRTWDKFWSFQPVRRPAVPEQSDTAWPRNEIDHFVLAAMKQKGLRPAAEADKYTLIRRLTFDLTGLPPTIDEIRQFVADTSPDAYEKLVDRLLASPHYGERYGRHWLDVARYVQGRITFPGVARSSGDQPYRDYVVRAFNNDKPYDRFVTEQLAGDLLPPAAGRQDYFDQLIAPAFLSIGAWFDMETDPNRLRLEMIDEMISTTSKAFMGLSMGCAQCHDHKFDPIPASDYYALGGIFRSTKIVGELSDYWRDGRVRQLRALAMPAEVAANNRIRDQVEAKRAQWWLFLTSRHHKLMTDWQADEARYRTAAGKIAPPHVKLFEAEDFSGQSGLRIAQLMRDGKGVEVVETLLPKAQWVKYTIEVPRTTNYQLDALYSAGDRTPLTLTVNGSVITRDALAQPTGGADLKFQRWENTGTFELREGMNFLRLDAKEGNFPRIDRFRLYETNAQIDARIQSLAFEEKLNPALLRSFILDPAQPWPPPANIESYLSDGDRVAAANITGEIEELSQKIVPYDLTIAVTDQATPADLPIHPRGSTYRTSDLPSPRGVPSLLDGALPRPDIPAAHSGRLELAHWLTDVRHPLTARVMANRLWYWHFGQGIVATTSDFGSRGTLPSHPELLDWLAAELRVPAADSRGASIPWSIKRIQRLILTSSTYRMSSRAADSMADRSLQVDPDNRLLSHFPRQRLDAEALFDSLFSTRNILPRQPSDAPLDIEKSKGRALYVLTSGRSPEGLGIEVRKMLSLFDYDPSGAPIAERPRSSTPAQALFWLNSPLVKYYADKFAERLLKMDRLDDVKRVEQAYLIAIGHPASPEFAAEGLRFIQQSQRDDGLTPQQAWSQFCQVLFGSDEFRYID
jgi:hypothetical protein